MYQKEESVFTSINRVQEYAAMHEKGFYECLKGADLIPDIGRGVSKLESFVALIEHFKVDAKELTLHELMRKLLTKPDISRAFRQRVR